jgi:dienelactone hydrolase
VTTALHEHLQATLGSDYQIERELGGGGMSRVFLARDVRLDRAVVVKVLTAEVGASLSSDRFEREIRFAARLQDPHIVPLLHAGGSGELQYYTMPFVDGETLRTRMSRGPMPVEASLEILRDILLALEYAHRHHVVHRDIKPENVLLTGRSAVVADFGIAKAVVESTRTSTDDALTAMGTIVGTPAYMAPEQAAGDPVDARTDLYAWGVIAYEMLSGAHPFATNTTAQALLAAHIAETPKPLALRRRDIPAPVAALIDRCLAKDPSDRPAQAADVLARLAAIAPRRTAAAPYRRWMLIGGAIVAVASIAIAGVWQSRRADERRWAREDAGSEIEKLVNGKRALDALRTARRAAAALPGDTAIAARLQRLSSQRETITSSPPGALVMIQDFVAPTSAWDTLGTTPLVNIVVPPDLLRFRVSKPGVASITAAPAHDRGDTLHFALDILQRTPTGMVHVGARRWGNMIAFVGWVGPYRLPPFDLDKFEVTNKAFQVFVDSGGYRNPQWWKEPVVQAGRTLSFAEAMLLFRDRSGRAGPSTWEGGHYAPGKDAYPVSGVSWYEASAYAAFAGKSLPTFAQWYAAAPGESAPYLVRTSNISKASLAPVGSTSSEGPYGTYDMAGNVREWTMNSLGADRRFILGGAWNSLTYLAADPEALTPLDRSEQNGIRCVTNLAPLPPELLKPIKPLERDFARFVPVADDVFAVYRAMYAYNPVPLNPTAAGPVRDETDWRIEKVLLDTPYNRERMAVYVFVPKRIQPPYQAVIFFPSARVEDESDSRELGDVSFFDYIVQSGRAVVYPVYQDTYERRMSRGMPGTFAASVIVQRAIDVGRTIDYVQSRSDMATDKLAYLGVSMGAAEGVIYTTLQQERLKAAVFLDGGFFLNDMSAVRDQANFAPRLKTPTLMVNGRYDFTFSLERSQTPLFKMLGAPSADKRHVVMETPHDVRADRPLLVREVLGWLDKYLGRVQ